MTFVCPPAEPAVAICNAFKSLDILFRTNPNIQVATSHHPQRQEELHLYLREEHVLELGADGSCRLHQGVGDKKTRKLLNKALRWLGFQPWCQISRDANEAWYIAAQPFAGGTIQLLHPNTQR